MRCGICGSTKIKQFYPVEHWFCEHCKAHYYWGRWIDKDEWEHLIKC